MGIKVSGLQELDQYQCSERLWVTMCFPFTHCNLSISSVLWHCWLGDRKVIQPVRISVLVVMIWLELCKSYSSSYHYSIILSSSKIQNRDILAQAYLGFPRKVMLVGVLQHFSTNRLYRTMDTWNILGTNIQASNKLNQHKSALWPGLSGENLLI